MTPPIDRFFYSEIQGMQQGKRTCCNEAKRQRHDTHILEFDPSSPENVKYKLKSGCHLHLYISQLPCNPNFNFPFRHFSRIFSIDTCLSYVGGYASTSSPLYALKKIPSTQVDDESLSHNGSHSCSLWTSDVQDIGIDTLLPATCKNVCILMFSISGNATDTVQRKPGRGETTLSVSCSDKIARWNVLGVQGFFSILLISCIFRGFAYGILNSLPVSLLQGLCFTSSFSLCIFLPSPLDSLCTLLTTFLSLITCEDLCMRGSFPYPMSYCLPSV